MNLKHLKPIILHRQRRKSEGFFTSSRDVRGNEGEDWSQTANVFNFNLYGPDPWTLLCPLCISPEHQRECEGSLRQGLGKPQLHCASIAKPMPATPAPCPIVSWCRRDKKR